MNLQVDGTARALVSIYQQAEARLELLIARALASDNIGTLKYRRARLAEVQQILTQLRAASVQRTPALADEAYRTGARLAALPLVGELAGPHKTAVRVVAENMDSTLAGATDFVGRRVNDVFRRATLEQVAIGIATGDARRDTSRALMDQLRSRGIKAFVDRRGAQWNLATYTEMAVRTTTREAVVAGTVNRLSEAGIDLVTVSTHKDTDGPDVCNEMEGRTFSISGNTPGYPTLTIRPPFHPRCRHVLLPAKQNLEAFEASLGITIPA